MPPPGLCSFQAFFHHTINLNGKILGWGKVSQGVDIPGSPTLCIKPCLPVFSQNSTLQSGTGSKIKAFLWL